MFFKKLAALLGVSALFVSSLVGCSSSSAKKIVVGASPMPHGQILKIAQAQLKEKGYELEIKEMTDYVTPNLALSDKSLDANFFQHKPYLEKFNKDHNTDLVSAGEVHYEPYGLYPGRVATIEALPEKGIVAIPNDATNGARALLLLQKAGLITLRNGEKSDISTTILDIVENPKNIEIKELEAAQLPRVRQDVDLVVINGNYALEAGLNVNTDSLVKEESDSLAATMFPNIVAVRKGEETTEKSKALMEALHSDAVRTYIEETYKGAVVPTF